MEKNPLIAKQNLLLVSQKYYNKLQKISTKNDIQELLKQNQIDNLSLLLKKLGNFSRKYYKNLSTYLFFKIRYFYYSSQIFKLYKEIQGVERKTKLSDKEGVKKISQELEKAYKSWLSLHKIYASYPGHLF